MRSDWDDEHAARKGRNQHGESTRNPTFTMKELETLELALEWHYARTGTPHADSAAVKVARALGVRHGGDHGRAT